MGGLITPQSPLIVSILAFFPKPGLQASVRRSYQREVALPFLSHATLTMCSHPWLLWSSDALISRDSESLSLRFQTRGMPLLWLLRLDFFAHFLRYVLPWLREV